MFHSACPLTPISSLGLLLDNRYSQLPFSASRCPYLFFASQYSRNMPLPCVFNFPIFVPFSCSIYLTFESFAPRTNSRIHLLQTPRTACSVVLETCHCCILAEIPIQGFTHNFMAFHIRFSRTQLRKSLNGPPSFNSKELNNPMLTR